MTKSLTSKLQDFFKTQPVEKAWVFGSFSRGEEREDSDVDILVKFDKSERISLLRYCKMICDLEDLTGRSRSLINSWRLPSYSM